MTTWKDSEGNRYDDADGAALSLPSWPSGLTEMTADELAEVTELTATQKLEAQIVALESTVTQRRLREAALGTDNGWLKALDAQISALRAQL